MPRVEIRVWINLQFNMAAGRSNFKVIEGMFLAEVRWSNLSKPNRSEKYHLDYKTLFLKRAIRRYKQALAIMTAIHINDNERDKGMTLQRTERAGKGKYRWMCTQCTKFSYLTHERLGVARWRIRSSKIIFGMMELSGKGYWTYYYCKGHIC
jgi:hypothetical protein